MKTWRKMEEKLCLMTPAYMEFEIKRIIWKETGIEVMSDSDQDNEQKPGVKCMILAAFVVFETNFENFKRFLYRKAVFDHLFANII